MNKAELITTLAAKTDATKADTLRFVDALEQTIREELQRGGEIPLAITGKFKVKTTAERTGRNPKTGEALVIPAKRKVTFTPAKALKDAISH